jgi:lipopolysaccharide biosynthesis protein
VRQAQADLAKQYGIYGFCYYHYWFNGKQLLSRPFQEVLEMGQPNFPFCLCWANENWTRRWDGKNNDILIQQVYSEQDDISHIHALLPALTDSRYIRHEGKPLLLIYRATQLPNPQKTLQIWREEARRAGLEGLHICRVESSPNEQTNPSSLGFDGAVEFQPDWALLRRPLRRNIFWLITSKLGFTGNAFWDFLIFDYEYLVNESLQKPNPSYERFPCVTPQWDNSPRKEKGGIILRNSTPQLYERWLINVIQKKIKIGDKGNFIFINAWNEWGEGNHLEPDAQFNHSYLEATKRAIDSINIG